MAISDLKPARYVRNKNGEKDDPEFEYSHLLTPEHRAEGYRLVVRNPQPYAWDQSEDLIDLPRTKAGVRLSRRIIATLRHNGKKIGFITGNVQHGFNNPDWDESFDPPDTKWVDDHAVKVGHAYIDDDKNDLGDFVHRGKRLGIPMYEALYTHAKTMHGAKHVIGGVHSSMAHAAHEKLAAKHGLRYQASPNYAEFEDRAEGWDGVPDRSYDNKWAPYRYTLKSEEPLEKMAIADIPVGTKLGSYQDGDRMIDHFDYSHVLAPEQRAEGYRVTVEVLPHRADMAKRRPWPSAIFAHLTKGHAFDPNHRESRAHVCAEVASRDPSVWRVDSDSEEGVHEKGKGLGRALYEAAYAHASKFHGATTIEGRQHSKDSHHVHESLKRRHGVEYNAGPVTSPRGTQLSTYEPYRYAIKSEEPLDKAIGDIPPGAELQMRTPKDDFDRHYHERGQVYFDYSHVLPENARKQGMKLVVFQPARWVEHEKQREYEQNGAEVARDVEYEPHRDLLRQKRMAHYYEAKLLHRGKAIGLVRAEHGDPGDGQHVLGVTFSELKRPYRGRGLGMSLYEAAYRHGQVVHGATHIRGGEHSSMAHAAHKRLAEKHGMRYGADPNIGEKRAYNSEARWRQKKDGPFDNKWGSYQYTIR